MCGNMLLVPHSTHTSAPLPIAIVRASRRFVGEAPLAGGSEVVGPAEERVVSVAERGPTCPTGIGSAGKGGLSMTAGGEASGMVNHDVAAAPAGAGDVEGGSLARPSGLVGGQSVVV
jgi:hypothetical protein